ncbi:energy transducer TonB [Hylemonella gracilis]|uniref:TonB family protein n=1 Tax=Hylemonella gracilis ATCC 19624 TaxID=887062 RepID=F3KQV5_9BURK|nr:energy transducer TonB [Hylemonella gracilis]EGI77875.1 TonB family protein [Hylemonella gracilis ATCC 19624]
MNPGLRVPPLPADGSAARRATHVGTREREHAGRSTQRAPGQAMAWARALPARWMARWPALRHTLLQVLRDRRFHVAVAVALAHAGAIWLVHQGGSKPGSTETLVNGELISEIVAPPTPNVAAQPQSAPKPQPRPNTPVPPQQVPPTPALQETPSPLVQETPQPTTPQTDAAPIETPVVAQQSAAPPPPQRTQQPTVDASYLYNKHPAYPDISRRMNEQGQVLVRVLVGTKGEVLRAELGKSSGYPRLDRTAVAAVRGWRFLPGQRDGQAEAMWFNVPINFVLEQ